MAKKKLSAKNEFLNWFDGHYQKELPTDDKGMFLELAGLAVARETFDMTERLTDLVLSNDESRAKKEFSNVRRKFMKDGYNAFIAYICEVKGFAGKGVSREYRNWYIEMSKWYESNKEECTVKVFDRANYFSDVTRTYMFARSLS